MKILFFIHSLSSGGAERVLSLLANDWQNKGHNITIALNRVDCTFYKIDKSINIIDIGVQQKGFAKEIIGNLKRIQKIRHTIDDIDPDIVIGFMTTMNIYVTIAAKLAGKPVIISERNNFHFIKSPIWKILRRIVYPYANTLIVQTSYDNNKYQYHPNVRVIENPLLLNNEHDNTNTQREKLILAVGRLHTDKGFDMLIEAFSLLKDVQDLKLIILGEGNERVNLEKQISLLRLEKLITLPGTISDVEPYYKKASVFVLSSRAEGFPNVLCEAMGYGCPSIAFDCLTGPRDIIEHQYNGLLVEAKNVGELSKAMRYLIEDKEQREFLSSNSVKISDRLDIENITKKWLKAVES